MTAVEMTREELRVYRGVSPARKTRTIIVASDGSDHALAAYNAAKLIQEHGPATVHVVSVLETIPVYFPPSNEGVFVAPQLEDSREEAHLKTLHDQLREYDSEGQWTTSVRLGRPAEVIVDFALLNEADLIIVGSNRHSMAGRFFGEDTAMEIVRRTEIPLLVASPDMQRLPKRVVVAMDLNRGGLATVPDVLPMLADTATITCAHVKPRSEFLGVDWADLDREYEQAMNERFEVMEGALTEVNLRPDLVVLHGDPVHELAEYVAFAQTELLVVGVKRRRGRARAIGGRFAGRVLRKISSSVLVVPGTPVELSAEVPAGASTSVIRDSRLWETLLRDFTGRNAGRIADLEVDDSEIGAMSEASRYPLAGIDYDHRNALITITLGDLRGTERHLTRSIHRPEYVSVLSVDGRDKALSVKHGAGQTLLMF